MKPTDLVALCAITRKPGQKIEQVQPGQSFSPKDDDERAFLIRTGAARPPVEAEITVKKAAARKSAKKPDPEPEVKPVALEADDAAATDDMLG